MDTSPPITHIGLCAGYGGIELGLHRVIRNLRSVALCEIEAFACANLVAKMEAGLLDAAPIWTNLKTFPWAEFRDRVDILTGGYPCQPFSAAGKRLGTEDPRHLWPFIADGIRVLRPKLCFFENVEGHISLGLREVIGELESIGYTAAWGIFSAGEVGAPHQRKRVFILAHRKSDERDQPEARNWGEMLAGGSAEELANSKRAGLEGQHHRHASAEPSQYVGADAWAGGERDAWPSRPGEQQHEWEPPRVVGAVPAKLANFCSRDSQQGRDTAQAGGESISAWRKNEDAMPHSRSSVCGGDQGDEQAMGNSILHGHSACEITGGTCEGENQGRLQEPSGGSGAMGNAERQGLSRKTFGCMGKSEVVTEGCWGGETQPAMGGDADGPAGGLGYAELCVSCDNRTDELRLLGNGVVPATATRAFLTLWEELFQQQPTN